MSAASNVFTLGFYGGFAFWAVWWSAATLIPAFPAVFSFSKYLAAMVLLFVVCIVVRIMEE